MYSDVDQTIRIGNRSRVCMFSSQKRGIHIIATTDYGLPEGKQRLLHGRKFNHNPKFLGMAKAYLVCQIGPIFQISWIYVFIGCPQSVIATMAIFHSFPGFLKQCLLKGLNFCVGTGIKQSYYQSSTLLKFQAKNQQNFFKKLLMYKKQLLLNTLPTHLKICYDY